jgi:DNA processing protein
VDGSSRLAQVPASRWAPEDLLGPLNDHERKYAPDFLFVAGDIELARQPRVSIVGSRRPSEAGLKRAARLARELVRGSIVVVSGLAAGIDRRAHEASIAEGGKTIAVLGTPLDQVTPKGHESLQLEIMTGHLAISQFPSGHRVDRTTFPLRNRTMALASDATVIIEATDGSGTQHQGWEAIRLGRPLFLLRSLVEDRAPDWIGKMLDYGAIVLAETDQVLERIPDPSADTLAANVAF